MKKKFTCVSASLAMYTLSEVFIDTDGGFPVFGMYSWGRTTPEKGSTKSVSCPNVDPWYVRCKTRRNQVSENDEGMIHSISILVAVFTHDTKHQ